MKFLKASPALTIGFLVLDYLNRPAGVVRPHDLALHGFRLICSVPPNGGYNFNPAIPYSGPDTRSAFGSTNPGLSCTLGGQVADDNMTNGVSTLPAGTRWVAYGPDNHGGVVRFQLREQWSRPSPLPTPAVAPNLSPYAPPGRQPSIPVPLPYPYPQIDPFIYPPFTPQPIPNPIPFRAIPHRRPNPNRVPDEQPVPRPSQRPGRGAPPSEPGPDRRTNEPDYDEWRRGVRRRKPRHKPDEVPVGEVELTPHDKHNPRRNTSPQPATHKLRKPIRGSEREKKGVFSIRGGTFLAETLGLITESLDVLDAFFKALPKQVQAQYTWKGSNPWERAVFVTNNLDQIQIGTLVANLVSMLLEDAAFGKLGKIGAKANQSLHRHFGRDIQGRLPKPYNSPVITVPT